MSRCREGAEVVERDSGLVMPPIRMDLLRHQSSIPNCEQLAKLLTRMLEGRLASTLWLQSRRCVLASGGYRPLGINDAWYSY